jgi:ATP-dependent helicase/nuclease subunit B
MARGSKRAQPQGQLSFGELRPLAPAVPSGPALLVLPDAARVEDHLRRAASQSDNGLAPGGKVCTVSELEKAIIAAARGKLLVASPGALELTYRKIAREKTPRGSPWFAVRETTGFARALRDLASALGQGMLAPPELALLIPKLENENAQRRLGPLARLLELARAELEKNSRCDAPTALLDGLRSLRTAPGLDLLPPLLRGISLLRFESVLDWPPLRLELLFALAEVLGRAEAPVRVHLVLPYWPDRPQLAGEPLAPVLRALEERGGERGARGGHAVPELELTPVGEEGSLGPFRSRLFAASAPELADSDDESEAEVLLASCASPSAEAREAARRCADLLDAGAPADSIAVAVRSLAGGSAEELGFAFDQLGISWRERRGRPALSSPPIQLALSFYELLEQDFPREPFAALLSSRQLWMRAEGERAPGEAIAHRLQQARVRDDRSDGGIAAQLGRLAARLGRSAEVAEGFAKSALERELREVEEVKSRCLRAATELKKLPAEATLRAHGAALLALLDKWELRKRAQRSLDERAEAHEDQLSNTTIFEARVGPLARAAAAAQLRAIASIDALESCCADLARAAREAGQEHVPFSRAEWAELLAGALGEVSLRPPGARGAAVQLVELRELPGKSCAHLVVAGLVEGQLPAKASIDPLLSDEEKRALNRAAQRAIFRAASRGASSSEGPARPARQAEEPHLFQLALTAARESILLLWPRADSRGREAPRSTFADEAARALRREPGDGETRARPTAGQISRLPLAAIPELAACRGVDELLARASLDAIADPAFRALAPAPAEQARALLASLARSPLRNELGHVARAALAERERLGTFVGSRDPGRFSGQLSGAALGAVAPLFAFGEDSPLSARQLEEDALCSFRTFGNRVLHLRQDVASEDDLTPLEKGVLLHRLLEVFYARLREEKRLPLTAPRDQWAKELRTLAQAEMATFAQTRDTGHRALWKLRQEELLELLEEVIATETALQATPLELEQSFGFAKDAAWAPLRIPSPDGTDAVFARGAIDRVDATSNSLGNGRMVIDYKSGRLQPLSRKLRSDAIFAPEFQLLLYVAAVRAREPGKAVDAVYLSLKDARRSTTLSAALGKASLVLDELVELEPARRKMLREKSETGDAPNLGDAVWKRVAKLRRGALLVDPLDCDRCDLKPVCRIAALPVDEELLK